MLVGCANQAGFAPAEAGYRHTLIIQSANTALKTELKEKLGKLGVSVVPQTGFADLNLSVVVTPSSAETLSNAPRIFGKLQQESRPQALVASYALTTSAGEVLTEGEVVGLAQEKVLVFPRSNAQSVLQNKQALAEAATQITENISPHTQTREWRTRVISVQNSGVVMISAGKAAGLKVFDTLVSRSTPATYLQVATFEKMGSGVDRAILRVTSGPLPPAGTILYRP